jgi:hypothetical protein
MDVTSLTTNAQALTVAVNTLMLAVVALATAVTAVVNAIHHFLPDMGVKKDIPPTPPPPVV